MQAHARRWVYPALTYFLLAIALGVFMAASHDHRLMPVHAHLNLLGWVSLALTATVYHFFPAAGTSRLADVHFWLYNAALPVMMVGLAMLLRGATAVEPLVAAASVAVLAAVLLFVVNVFRHRA